MKKLVFALLIGLLINSKSTIAQVFDDGTNVISIGFGLPPEHKDGKDFQNFSIFNNENYTYKFTNLGTILLKFEHGIHKNFGLGLNTEYTSTKATYADPSNEDFSAQVKSNIFAFFLRLNGHLPVTEKLDLYGGVGLGYEYTIDKYSAENSNQYPDLDQTSKVFESLSETKYHS